MKVRNTLSNKEILILAGFFLVALITGLIYWGLGELQKDTFRQSTNSSVLEIAVLVPRSGPQAEMGEDVLKLLQEVARDYTANRAMEASTVLVTAYDTRSTANGAANAVREAAKNPNTAVIIGPLDSRQVLAAAENNPFGTLMILTPSSTSLDSPPRNVLRFSLQDDFQGDALVYYLYESLFIDKIGVILGDIQRETMNAATNFERASFRKVEISMVLTLEDGELPAGWEDTAATSQVDRFFYIGSTPINEEAQAALLASFPGALFVSFDNKTPMDQFIEEHLKPKDVFIAAETTDPLNNLYIQRILNRFNQSAEDKLRVTGIINVTSEGIPADFIEQLQTQTPDALLYFGSIRTAKELLGLMEQADVNIPFVSSDIINDASLLPLTSAEIPIYYVSPYFNLPGYAKYLEKYQLQLADVMPETLIAYLAGHENVPFAYESTQLLILALEASNQRGNYSSFRQRIYENIPRIGIEEFDKNDRLVPADAFFVYQATEDWGNNPIVYYKKGR